VYNGVYPSSLGITVGIPHPWYNGVCLLRGAQRDMPPYDVCNGGMPLPVCITVGMPLPVCITVGYSLSPRVYNGGLFLLSPCVQRWVYSRVYNGGYSPVYIPGCVSHRC